MLLACALSMLGWAQFRLRVPSFLIYWSTTILLVWWNLASCSVVLLLLQGLPALFVRPIPWPLCAWPYILAPLCLAAVLEELQWLDLRDWTGCLL